MSTLQVNTISESTSGSGVTIDGVKLKDNIVETDTINEKTSAAGVTIDGVLIKDGKVTGGATGLTLVNKTTFTNASTVTVDNIFTSTYANYRINLDIEITDGGDSTPGRIGFRTGGASGSNHSTSQLYLQNYEYKPLGASTAYTHVGADEDNYFQLGSFGNYDTYYNIEIGNPQVAKHTHAMWNGTLSQGGGSSETDWAYSGHGIVINNDVLTGMTFFSSDNSTVSGIVYVYGYGE